MKTLLILLSMMSAQAYAQTADYQCKVRQYDVSISLTQDTSTSMWLRDRYEVLAMGYAGVVEKKGEKIIYHFYPQLGPTQIIFNKQDTIDLPEKLEGWIEVDSMYFNLRDKLHCFRTGPNL